MPYFRVPIMTTIFMTLIIEANDRNEAIERAYDSEDFPSDVLTPDHRYPDHDDWQVCEDDIKPMSDDEHAAYKRFPVWMR